MSAPSGGEHERKSVWIEGAPAIAFVRAPAPGDELMSVKEAADVDKALGDPGNTQHCPLCNEYFGTEAFVAHAQDCINANAPRWERNREEEPPYGNVKQFRSKLWTPGVREESAQ